MQLINTASPVTSMKSVDRGAHIAAFINRAKEAAPLVRHRASLRANLLAVATHFHFKTDAEWADHVREVNAREMVRRAEEAKKLLADVKPISLEAVHEAGKLLDANNVRELEEA